MLQRIATSIPSLRCCRATGAIRPQLRELSTVQTEPRRSAELRPHIENNPLRHSTPARLWQLAPSSPRRALSTQDRPWTTRTEARAPLLLPLSPAHHLRARRCLIPAGR